jgi:L-ascorbate metabolism protein UlaG (beta-lactamase superfamily)
VKVRFHGHACFSIVQGGSHLLLDPFEPGGLNGAVQLPRPAVDPTHVVCTHQHSDHAAVEQYPMASVVMPGFTNNDMHIDGLTVHHDMHDGGLRGGRSTVLRVQTADACVVHLGDIGERLQCSHVEWLREVPPDVLIVPAGGWYTLDAGGALEVIRLIRPGAAWVCHTRDDGVKLVALDDRRTLLHLWTGPSPELVHEWTLPVMEPTSETRLLLGRATP